MDNSTGIDPKFAEVARLAIDLVEGIKRTGLEILELADRHVRLRMPLQGNSNHVGIMYAGSLFTLGEITGGIIPAVSMDLTHLVPIVKEVNIRFRAPAMSDVFLTADIGADEAANIYRTAVEQGKADFKLDLELQDVNGAVVAIVSGTWQVRSISRGF